MHHLLSALSTLHQTSNTRNWKKGRRILKVRNHTEFDVIFFARRQEWYIDGLQNKRQIIVFLYYWLNTFLEFFLPVYYIQTEGSSQKSTSMSVHKNFHNPQCESASYQMVIYTNCISFSNSSSRCLLNVIEALIGNL